MEVEVIYRPISGTFRFKTEIGKRLNKGDMEHLIEDRKLDLRDDDDWNVLVSVVKVLNKTYITGGICVGIDKEDVHWLLWLSMYMPHEFLKEVETMTRVWNEEWETSKVTEQEPLSVLIKKTYRKTIEVPNEDLFMEEPE